MRAFRHYLLAASAFLASASAGLADIALSPASPQPDEATLSQGLFVTYSYPQDVRSLDGAEHQLKKRPFAAKAPLVGFDYPDTREGDNALTSRQAFVVAAKIEGFIRFDAPGRYDLEFHSNDGLRVTIGGQMVSEYDGRHPCSSPGAVTVQAPSAGWYALEAIYFQRQGTSCLLMEWAQAGGEMNWTPNEAFAYRPK